MKAMTFLEILGIWFLYHFITRILYQVQSKFLIAQQSPLWMQWALAAFYLSITAWILVKVLKWKNIRIPRFFSSADVFKHRLFFISTICFFGWMIAYLFFIRYQPNQWSTLSINHFLTYTKTHFPDGLLSEFQEEASYRGLLYGLAITHLGPARAAVFQAFMFLLPHYIGVAHGHMDLTRSFSTFLLGLIFCGFRISSGGLILPTVFHILWNLVSTFMFLSIEEGY